MVEAQRLFGRRRVWLESVVLKGRLCRYIRSDLLLWVVRLGDRDKTSSSSCQKIPGRVFPVECEGRKPFVVVWVAGCHHRGCRRGPLVGGPSWEGGHKKLNYS